MKSPARANRRPLSVEPLESRRCLAMGDLDLTFGIDGYFETSHPHAANQWDSIGLLDEGPDHFTQVLQIRGGSGQGIALVRMGLDGALTDDFGGDGQVNFFDPLVGDQAINFVRPIRLVDGSYLVHTSGGTSHFRSTLHSLLPSGELNRNFGDNGLLRLPPAYEYTNVRLTPHPSGGFCLWTSDGKFWKYHADGTIDRDFGFEGQLILRNVSRGPDFDNQGKLLFYGTAPVGDGETMLFRQLRFLPGGVADPAFGTDGELVTVGSLKSHNPIALPGGGFLGMHDLQSGTEGTTFYVRKVDANGELDHAFGQAGQALIEIPGFEGRLTHFNSIPTPDDGLLIGFIERVYSNRSRIVLVKITAAGALDADFGAAGVAANEVTEALQARTTQLGSDNSVYVWGETFTGGYDSWLMKFGSDGRVDRTFGSDGTLRRDYTPLSRSAELLSLYSFPQTDPPGWLVNSGWEGEAYGGTSTILNHNGVPLRDFDFGGTGTRLHRTVPASDGGWFQIVPNLSGPNARSIRVQKVLSDGSRDLDFGENGELRVDSVELDDLHTEPAGDGSLMVFGTSDRWASDEDKQVWGAAIAFRLNDQGLDTAFAAEGVLRLPEGDLQRGYVLDDGVLLQLTLNGRLVMQKYLQNGSPDLGYGSQGQAELPTVYGAFKSGATDELGRVYLLFDQNRELRVVRVSRQGTLSSTFGHGGRLVLADYAAGTPAQLVAGQGLVTLVYTADLGDQSRLRLQAVDYDGGPYEELGPFGIRDHELSSGSEYAVAAKMDSDGNLIVATSIREQQDQLGRVYRFEGTEALIRHNWALSNDVNRDGVVSPLDALLLVNVLNGAAVPAGLFVDTSNDGAISSLDALLVVNALNRGSLVGQGESGWEPPASLNDALVDAVFESSLQASLPASTGPGWLAWQLPLEQWTWMEIVRGLHRAD